MPHPRIFASILLAFASIPLYGFGAPTRDPIEHYQYVADLYYADLNKEMSSQDIRTQMKELENAFNAAWTLARRCGDIKLTSRFIGLRVSLVDQSETIMGTAQNLALYNPHCFIKAVSLLSDHDFHRVVRGALELPAAEEEIFRFQEVADYGPFFRRYGERRNAS